MPLRVYCARERATLKQYISHCLDLCSKWTASVAKVPMKTPRNIMHAENSYARKLILFLGAVSLVTAPIHAQTLQASASSITIGQVINCNSSQLVNITSSGAAITFTASITYAVGDVHGTWLSAEDLSTTHITNGTSPITITVGSGATLGLLVNLNEQIGVSDTATLTLTSISPVGQTITIPVTLNSALACPGLTVNNGVLTAIPASISLSAAQGQTSSQDTIVSNISSSPVTFMVGSNPFFSWLSANSGTYTLQPGQSIAIVVTASAGSMAPGAYSGAIAFAYGPDNNSALFLNVTLTVTSG